jgi:Ca2+-binding RTX toxin-like protein
VTFFSATQPVNLTAGGLKYAFSIFGHNKPVILEFLDQHGHELKFENPSGTVEFDFISIHGHPFTFSGHNISGGEVASIQINLPAGSIAYKFSGMHVPMAGTTGLVTDVDARKFGALLNLLMPGHDVIKGSSGNDILGDNNGHDRITGGLGSDLMYGNHGNDTFAFHVGLGTDHDKLKEFITTGANHDTVLLFADTGITKSNLSHHEHYDSHHNVFLTDSMGDTITFVGITSKAALNGDFLFHA